MAHCHDFLVGGCGSTAEWLLCGIVGDQQVESLLSCHSVDATLASHFIKRAIQDQDPQIVADFLGGGTTRGQTESSQLQGRVYIEHLLSAVGRVRCWTPVPC